MNIFFDTEFYEDGKTIELISIGLVREDGKQYYAETVDSIELASKNDWLIENVRANLSIEKEHLKTREQIAKDILEFVAYDQNDRPKFWSYFADYDWVVFCQLYGSMIDLPYQYPQFCLDLKQACLAKGILSPGELPDRVTGAEHNALSDALWHKEIHEFLEAL